MHVLTDPVKDAASMHLPRILCLHGGGTNATIFRLQCRMLMRALASSFRFVFVEAPYTSPPGPDVAPVFSDMGPFKAWLCTHREEQARTSREAVDRIYKCMSVAMDEDDKLGGTGEYVGLLGFSQGARMCASILYAQQESAEWLEKPATWPCFRFAVLMAGRGPLVWLDGDAPVPEGLIGAGTPGAAQNDAVAAMPVDARLYVPTLHVHGLLDLGLSSHRDLLDQCCELESTRLLEWRGAHRVAVKPAEVTVLVQEIMALTKKAGKLEFF